MRYIFLALFCIALQAGDISKIDIVVAKRGMLGAYIYGAGTSNVIVSFDGERIENCRIDGVSSLLDRVVRQWALQCKLPNRAGKVEIKYFDTYNKRQTVAKFIN